MTHESEKQRDFRLEQEALAWAEETCKVETFTYKEAAKIHKKQRW